MGKVAARFSTFSIYADDNTAPGGSCFRHQRVMWKTSVLMKFKVPVLASLFDNREVHLKTAKCHRKGVLWKWLLHCESTWWRLYLMPEGENAGNVTNYKLHRNWVADVFDFSEITLFVAGNIFATLKYHHVAGCGMTFEFIANISGLRYNFYSFSFEYAS